MPPRVVICPSCGRKARFSEEPYRGHRVLIRCRQCTYEWWVEVGLEADTASETLSGTALQEARQLVRFIVHEIRYYHRDFIQKAQTRQEIAGGIERRPGPGADALPFPDPAGAPPAGPGPISRSPPRDFAGGEKVRATRCIPGGRVRLGLRCSVFGPRRRFGSGAGYQVPGAR